MIGTLTMLTMAGVLIATPVTAETPARTPDAAGLQATFNVTVVHAHNAKPGVDPKLTPLTEYLTKSFSRYKTFDQVGTHKGSVTVDGKTSTTLPDGKALTLVFRGVEKGFVKVYLELDGLKTTIDVRDGGLFFQAGRVYKGGILVLAIGAKTGPASSLGSVDTAGS